MSKVRIATVWLDGCSGCHMSFLDMDEVILDVADRIELVYSPLVDAKEFPDDVDVTLVEGAVSSEEDLHKAHVLRERSRVVVALGDCAVTGNVPSMRNACERQALYRRAYVENVAAEPGIPSIGVPPLRERAQPLHEVIRVDAYLPGCPPGADLIVPALVQLLEGRIPDLGALAHFG
jgi:NAD-reducing hydrogenase small subunit